MICFLTVKGSMGFPPKQFDAMRLARQGSLNQLRSRVKCGQLLPKRIGGNRKESKVLKLSQNGEHKKTLKSVYIVSKSMNLPDELDYFLLFRLEN